MITELPHGFEWATREYYATGIRATRIKNAPVQASPEWYIENVLPIMKRLAVAPLVDICVLNVPILCDWYFLVTSYISELQCVWADICHGLKSFCLNAPGQLGRYSFADEWVNYLWCLSPLKWAPSIHPSIWSLCTVIMTISHVKSMLMVEKASGSGCSYGIVAIAPFSHRLAFNHLPTEIQRLRCRVNFEALKFVPAIHQLGDTLIQRLQETSQLQDDKYALETAKYLALHLRFDKVRVYPRCDHCLSMTGFGLCIEPITKDCLCL